MKHFSQQGFSMIEVLVAVFILAVGLLGVAALQMGSMNSGQEGYFRTQALSIAEDLASRIRTNRVIMSPNISDSDGEMANVYAARYATNPAELYACAAAPVMCRPDGAAAAADCTVPNLIAFERWEVCSQAAALLPAGEVRTLLNGSKVSVSVGWTATQGRADVGDNTVVNADCVGRFGYAADHECVILEVIP